jgi:hypothetical protein
MRQPLDRALPGRGRTRAAGSLLPPASVTDPHLGRGRVPGPGRARGPAPRTGLDRARTRDRRPHGRPDPALSPGVLTARAGPRHRWPSSARANPPRRPRRLARPNQGGPPAPDNAPISTVMTSDVVTVRRGDTISQGFYEWCSGVKSSRAAENELLLKHIERIHAESRGTYGWRGCTRSSRSGSAWWSTTSGSHGDARGRDPGPLPASPSRLHRT